MADTELRERLARAAHAATNVGSDWPAIHEDRKKAWRKTADAVLAEAEAAGYTLTKRIPHHGKVNA